MYEAPPPVTQDEILAVFEADPDRVWSAQQLAERVWRNRGGEGEFDGPRHRRSSDVPLVTEGHLRRLLNAMCKQLVLARAKGANSRRIGIAFDGPRPGVQYYGLESTAQRFRVKYREAKDTHELGRDIARRLRTEHPGRFANVTINPNNGMIILHATVDQALDLLENLPPSDDLVDESGDDARPEPR